MLCDTKIKATPRHVTSEHDISWEQYQEIVKEHGGGEDMSKSSKDKEEDYDRRDPPTGRKSEEAVTEIALQSFQKTMDSMDKQERRLQEEKEKAEEERRRIQQQMARQRELQKPPKEDKSSDSGDFLKAMATTYISDLREEKQYMRQQESAQVQAIKQELEHLREQIEKEKEEQYDNPKKKEKGNVDVKITDESVKSLTQLGQQFVATLQQSQLFKYASENEDFPDVKDLAKEQLATMQANQRRQMEPQFNPEPSPANSPPPPSRKKSPEKTLDEILAEEE